MSIKRSMQGFTLIEMLIAIVVIGIGVAGVLAAYNISVRGSADALVGKQLVAIAEEMMEEVLLKPYGNGAIATASGTVNNCGSTGADRSAFAIVGAYNGYQTKGICNIEGGPVGGLESFGVRVDAQLTTLGNPSVAALRVTVTATHGNDHVVLDGFRTAYGGL